MRLGIFDVAGRQVHTLVNGAARPGRQEVAWNLDDATGHRVPGGVYFARFALGNAVSTRTIVVTP
jgi:hypothetical protein